MSSPVVVAAGTARAEVRMGSRRAVRIVKRILSFADTRLNGLIVCNEFEICAFEYVEREYVECVYAECVYAKLLYAKLLYAEFV